jgi:hypothetical protein
MGTISRDATKFFDKSFAYERRVFKYTGPSSYATNGDLINPESIALARIDALLGLIISNGSTQYYGWYDATAKKIKWFSATATEVSNATDLSTFVGWFEAIGK